MNFRQHDFDTRVTNLRVPLVLVAPQALSDMWEITDLHDKEIGWLGSVVVLDRSHFLIDEVFLVDQGAHAATTEISEQGLADLVEEIILTRGEEATDLINRLRFWGHSHVSMALTPSYQDDTQLRNLAQDTGDYFIAGRTNKKGEMRFDLLREDGLLITDIPWQVHAPVASRREHWQAQIKEKVRAISSVYHYGTGKGGQQDSFITHRNRNTAPQGATGSASGKGSGPAKGLPNPKSSGAGGTSGGASGSAGAAAIDFAPEFIDPVAGFFLDWRGVREDISNINNEELLAYGCHFFPDEAYAELVEKHPDVDIELELYDENLKGMWIAFGNTIIGEEDDEEKEFEEKLLGKAN